MAEAVLTRRSVVKNEYQLLADITVSGSAVTQIDITGLNIGKDEEIVLVGTIVNTSGSNSQYYSFVNNNITPTNYYSQELYASTTVVGASRQNVPRIANLGVGSTSLVNVFSKLTNNGNFVFQSSKSNKIGSSGFDLVLNYGTSTFTMTSITSLRIASSVANGIGIGSRFQLYRTGGV